jgi:hypothetical protein
MPTSDDAARRSPLWVELALWVELEGVIASLTTQGIHRAAPNTGERAADQTTKCVRVRGRTPHHGLAGFGAFPRLRRPYCPCTGAVPTATQVTHPLKEFDDARLNLENEIIIAPTVPLSRAPGGRHRKGRLSMSIHATRRSGTPWRFPRRCQRSPTGDYLHESESQTPYIGTQSIIILMPN